MFVPKWSFVIIDDNVIVVVQAGILEEMVDDAMESVNDDEELEEAAEGEVDKVLWELTAGWSPFFLTFL